MGTDEFSKRLKELMELEGVSKRALSLKIDVDRTSIRLWLNGIYYPRYDALIKLAVFFKVRIDSLLGLENWEKDVAELTVVEAGFCENVKECLFTQVAAFMKMKGWTKYAFSKQLKIDQKAFTNWLINGSMPETATIIRLSQIMNVSIDDLFGRKI